MSAWPGGVVFVVDPAQGPSELWVSDGTPQGTKRIVAGVPDQYLAKPTWNEHRKEFWYLSSGVQVRIAVSDGTAAGTRMLPGQSVGLRYQDVKQRYFTFTKSHAFYLADDGAELVSYAYANGKEQKLGVRAMGASDSRVVGGKLFFGAHLLSNTTELWESDGTVAGTRNVHDFGGSRYLGGRTPDERGSYWRLWNGQLALLVYAPQDTYEVWLSDGTAHGTRMLGSIAGDRGLGFLDVVGGELFAGRTNAWPNAKCELLRWNGAAWDLVRAPGAKELSSSFGSLTDLGNGRVLFGWWDSGEYRKGPGSGAELCTYDTKSRRLSVLRHWDPLSATAASLPTAFTALRQQLFCLADDGVNGKQVWRYDFVSGKGSRVVLQSTALYEKPQRLTVSGGRLFFTAVTKAAGRELFVWDEIQSVARMVADIGPGAVSGIREDGKLLDWNGRILFAADDGVHGREPWVSDGSASGTQVAVDLVPGPRNSTELAFAQVVGEQAVFFAVSGSQEGLWALSEAKSELLYALPSSKVPYLSSSVSCGEHALFAITQDLAPSPLYVISTDGTKAGTRKVLESTAVEVYDSPILGPALQAAPNGERAWLLAFDRGAQRSTRIQEFVGSQWRRELSAYRDVPLNDRNMATNAGFMMKDARDGRVWLEQGGKLVPFVLNLSVPVSGEMRAMRAFGAGQDLVSGLLMWGGALEQASGLLLRNRRSGECSLLTEVGNFGTQSLEHVSGHVVFPGDGMTSVDVEPWAVPMRAGEHHVGSSCGARPLRLDCSDPVQGKSSVLRLRYSGAYAASVLYFGTEARARTPLFGHCVAQFDALGFHLPIALWASNANGEAFDALPIPQDPAFTGQHFVLQAVSLDTQGKLSTSNGVLLVPGRM